MAVTITITIVVGRKKYDCTGFGWCKGSIDISLGERAKLTARLSSVDYVYNQLTSGGSDFSTLTPALYADQGNPGLASAFQDLTALMQRKTNLSFSLTPNSPQMKEIDGQINKAKENLIGIVMNIRKDLVMQINLISQREGNFAASLNRMPSTIKGLSDITRKKEINEKMYLFLLHPHFTCTSSSPGWRNR